jgi:hypothetical protein
VAAKGRRHRAEALPRLQIALLEPTQTGWQTLYGGSNSITISPVAVSVIFSSPIRSDTRIGFAVSGLCCVDLA